MGFSHCYRFPGWWKHTNHLLSPAQHLHTRRPLPGNFGPLPISCISDTKHDAGKRPTWFKDLEWLHFHHIPNKFVQYLITIMEMCLHFPCRLSSSSFSSTFSVSFCLFCFKSLHYAISNVSNVWATSQTCGLKPLPGLCNFTSGVLLNFSAPESFMWLLSELQFYFILSFKHKLGLYTMFNTGFIKHRKEMILTAYSYLVALCLFF